MKVTEEFPDGEWEENYRMRRWVSPEDAAGNLKAPGLRAIVRGFAADYSAGDH